MAKSRELLITLGADTTRFSQKVKRAKDLTRQLDADFKLLSSSSEKFESSLEGLAKKSDYYGNKIKIANELSKAHITKLKETQEELNKANEEYERCSKKVEELNEQIKQAKDNKTPYDNLEKQLEGATQELTKATKQVRVHTNQMISTKKSYAEVETELQNYQRELVETIQKMELMDQNDGFDNMKNDIKETNRTFELLSTSTKDFGNTMETLELSQNHYSDMVSRTTKLQKEYKVAMQNSSKTIEEQKSKVAELQKEMERYERMRDLYDPSDERFGINEEKVSELRSELTRANAIIEVHEKNIETLGQEYKATDKDLANFTNKLNTSTDKIKKMTDSVKFDKIDSELEKMAKNTLTRLEREIEDLDHAFTQLESSCSNFTNTTTGLESKQNHLINKIKLTRAQFNEYSKNLHESKQKTSELIAKKQELERVMQSSVDAKDSLNGKEFDEMVESLEKAKEEYEQVNKELEEWTNTLKESENGVKSSRTSLTNMNRELRENKNALEDLKNQKVFDSLEREIDEVNDELKLLDAQINLTRSKFNNYENSIFSVGNKQEMLTQQIQLTNRQIENYENSIKTIQRYVDDLGNKHSDLESRIDSVRRAMNDCDPEEQGEQYQRLTQQLARLEEEYDSVDDALQEYSSRLVDLQSEQLNAQASVNDLSRELNTSLGQALTATGQRIQNFGQGVQSVGQSMLPMTMAMSALGGLTVKFGMSFTQAMSEVGAVSGATGVELEQLTAKAREMGALTVYSATDASNALKYLALAGYDAQQAMDAIPKVLQLAQAGAMDLATASDLATDSISSLGYVGDDAVAKLPDYLNMVASTAMNANTSVEQLMQSYIKVGGQLDTMNIGIETSSTMLGVLANRGIKAEQAGNSLNSILINMTKKTGESSKGMKALGVSMFDAKGNIRDIEDVMIDMSKALAKLGSDEERVNIINMIGGKTQAKTLQKLLQGMVTDTGQLSEEYKSLKAEIEQGIETNSLKQMADQMVDNLYGDWASLKSVMEESFLSLFDAIEPTLRAITQNVVEFIRTLTAKFNSLSEGSQQLIFKIGLIATAIPPVLIVLGGMIKLFGILTSVVGSISTGFGLLRTTFTVFGATSGSLVSKLSSVKQALINNVGSGSFLGKIFGLLNTKTLLLAGGLGVVLGALVALWVKGQESTVEGSKGILKTLDTTSKEMVEPFLNSTQAIDTAMLKLKASTTKVTSEMVNDITSNISDLATQATDLLEKSSEKSVSVLEKNFKSMGDVEKKSQQSLINSIKKIYKEKVTSVKESQKAISTILGKARKEQRDLTQQELIEVQNHQQNIRDITLTAMSEYTSQMATIKQTLIDKEKELNAESVADAIKGAKEKKDQTVEQANNELNELVAIKKLTAGKLSKEDQKLLNDAIKSATTRKNETIKIAEEEYVSLIQTARKSARDQVDNIDWTTGEIKTKWERFWDNSSTGFNGFFAKLTNMGSAVKNTTNIMAKELQIIGLEIKKAWQNFWGQEDKAKETQKTIDTINKEIDALEKVGKAIDRSMTRFQNMPTEVQVVADTISNTLQQNLGVNLMEFVNNVDGSLDKVINDFDNLTPEVQLAFRDLEDALNTVGIGSLDHLISYLQGKTKYVRMEFNDMSTSAQQSMDALSASFKDNADTINGISFEDYVIMTQTSVKDANKVLEKLPEGVQNAIKNMPKEDWEQILTYYVTTASLKTGEVGDVIDTKGTENANKQYEKGVEMGEKGAQGITDGTENVKNAVDNLNKTTETALDNTGEVSYNKGAQATSKVAEGMNSNVGAVQESVGKIESALNNIDSIKLGGVTKQLSEVEKWLGKVSKASSTTKQNLTALQTVSYGGVTKGLSEVDKWLKDKISKNAVDVKNKLQDITKVTYGSTTKGLSEINKWLKDNITPSAVTAHSKLLTLSKFTFSGVISGLKSINDWLTTIKNNSSTTRTALLAVASATKASIDPNKPLGDPIPDFGFNMDAYNRNIQTMARDINMSNFKTSGGFYEPTSMTKAVTTVASAQDQTLTSLLKATIEQNQMLLSLLGQERQIVTYVNVDGRQIAKSSAKYMESEMNLINARKSRLGGR